MLPEVDFYRTILDNPRHEYVSHFFSRYNWVLITSFVFLRPQDLLYVATPENKVACLFQIEVDVTYVITTNILGVIRDLLKVEGCDVSPAGESTFPAGLEPFLGQLVHDCPSLPALRSYSRRFCSPFERPLPHSKGL